MSERKQPTNTEDALAGNVNAIRHVAYAEGYKDGVDFEKSRQHADKLRALNAQMLEALQLIQRTTNPHTHFNGGHATAHQLSTAAIKAAKGQA